jgi:hypothetical protein
MPLERNVANRETQLKKKSLATTGLETSPGQGGIKGLRDLV